MLEEKILNKYIAIDLFTRYKDLSDRYNSKEVLEELDKDLILEYLKELNCRFSFSSKEGFYGLSEQDGDYDFKFNVSLKYGMVEPVIWGKNVCSQEQYGGALIRVTKLIQKSMDVENVERIMYPRYKSVEDLKQIIKELYVLYQDFKTVVQEKSHPV